MTSCSDDASVITLSGSKWSNEDVYPFANQHTNPDVKFTIQQVTARPDEQTVLNSALKQRLEMYWAQVLQYQQNKSQAEQQQPPNYTNPTPEVNIEEAKQIMQKLISGTNDQPPTNLPWPSLAAMAANRPASYPELLPPPPLIPMSTTIQATSSNTVSNISAVLDLSKTSDIDQRYNPTILPDIKDTSNKNQPLDLTTSNKRRRTTESSEGEDKLMSWKPNLQSTPQKKLDVVTNKPNEFVPPMPPNSSPFSGFNAQQLAALGPYLQASGNPALQAMYSQNYQPMHNMVANGLPPAYLQKWLLAAQQQTAANQQPPKKRKKTDDINQQRSRVVFNPFVHNQKEIYLPTQVPMSPNASRTNSSPSHLTPASNSGPSGKRYKRYAKPPYSYVSLITLSILSSPEKKLRLSQILKRISEMFPFFNGSYQGWRDSVRHNLSQNECFVKVLKNPYRPTAKGNYWTVNITAIPHELLLRQNTLVSRYAQDSGFRYRKDLAEVFDLVTGRVKTGIPSHLFNGVKLVEDPAAVMEALLLEEKSDDEGSIPIRSNHGVYSLEDMFNQDDFIEEDLLRQHQNHGNSNNRWSAKSRQRASQAASKLSGNSPTFSTPTSYQQYITSIESQKLAAHMLRTSTANSILAQKDLLSKALGQHKLNCLPLLQNYYAKAHGNDNHQEHIETPTPAYPVNKSPQSDHPESPISEDFTGAWNHVEEKRNRRKGAQPTRRTSSGECKPDTGSLSPLASSAVDSGIAGSPRSSTRSFCSSEPDVSSSIVDHVSPLRSRASDVSSETLTSSPRDGAEDMMSPRGFSSPFNLFNSRPLETSKMA
ncbi:uncharacterized protein LOC100179778 [Ciona intestinalis]